MGMFSAVAIPVDLPDRNIYVAFNLETNYGLPPNDTHYNLIKKWNLNGMFSDISNGVTNIESARHQRSLYTRTNFYRSVIGYMEHFGLNGSDCLLRTICEVAESSIYESNGVLGSILHVLFMPTSSENENIPQALYKAEELGFKHNCSSYEHGCPESFL
ncbi:uncharacterized protein LOC129910433, partial [Episyrphus balteatus]|uniref:uncharacterized protein LOC129910433 n=1 Tax=Episyrphus balteatus TaxID=286459 RepID=UPI002485423B